MDLKGRSLLTLLDYSPEEIRYLINLAAELKEKKKAGIAHRLCEGKNIALIFEKISTRTRCAFEVAAADLGANTVYLDTGSSQIGKKESIADTARVLGRMFDGIEYRGYGQEQVELLAKHSGVPVWNGLTDEYHPTQVLADMLTIKEHFGELKGKTLVFAGDARFNMANSLMIGCAKLGVNYTACAPKEYFPNETLLEKCRAAAKKSGSEIKLETNPAAAVTGADVIYTDVWVSMGEPDTVWGQRIDALKPYRVTRELMEKAGPDCRFMHCLPAFHNKNTEIGMKIYEKYGLDCMEVEDEVFEGPQSIVFDQAENRLHTVKALIAATL